MGRVLPSAAPVSFIVRRPPPRPTSVYHDNKIGDWWQNNNL